MKFCEKCGKEILDETIDCNCSAETNADKMEPSQPNIEFLELIKNSKKTNIIAIVLIALGLIGFLFINGWLGAIICFIAEIIAVLPNTKVQKLFKSKHPEVDKKSLKNELKPLQNELKSKNKDFKLSFILGYIALAMLVISLVLPSPLFSGSNSNNKNNNYDSSSTTTNTTTQSSIDSTTDVNVANFLPSTEELDQRLIDTGLNTAFANGYLKGIYNKDKSMTLTNTQYTDFDKMFEVIYQYMKDIPGFSEDAKGEIRTAMENGEVRDALKGTAICAEFTLYGIEFNTTYKPLSYPKNVQYTGYSQIAIIMKPSSTSFNDFDNSSNGSSNSQTSSDYADQPVVGDFYFLYKESYFVNPDTGKTQSTEPMLPYITGLYFMGDGTGAVTCATNSGVKSYDITWREPADSETDTTKCYIVDYNNESVFVFYHKEDGYCFTSESNIVTYYLPCFE